MKYTEKRIVWITVSLLLSGCASVNPKPFSDYAASVKAAQDGIVHAVQIAQSDARQTLVENMASDPDAQFAGIQILTPSGYQWKFAAEKPPVYLSLKLAGAKLVQLNQVFSDYTSLLSNLAGSAIIDPAAFDQMAGDLNKNATQLTIDAGTPALSAGIPLFSTLATAAFKQFIESKRKDDLKTALTKNQETVELYTKQSLTLVHTLRGIVKSHYNQSFQNLSEKWAATRSVTVGKTVDQRGSFVSQTLALNDTFVSSLQMLEEVENALTAIPSAHAELLKGLDGPTGILPNVRLLVASGQHLQSLYQQLQSQQEATP